MSSKTNILDTAKHVISAEADALNSLSASLDTSFVSAVETILAAQGHIIVVGIGKSGHIGRKIAASLASTGTPSFFLHPSEAAHGDLGMISEGAVILALSHSGESAEVNIVADYAKEQSHPIIAICGVKTSSLAKKADTVLILPDMDEACPNQLAPTTSTTATLALGDALCVAVMTERGFTAEDFGSRHPAGKLGFGLKRVAQYLSEKPSVAPTIEASATMPDVILAMTSGGKGCVAVLDGQALCGIITDGDLRRAMSPDIMDKTARDIMTASPFTLSPDMRIKEVISAFTERGIGNAFVTDKDEIIGLIDLKTLLSTGYV